MAGRKPKPTALKLVQGNPGKRKLNTREPRPRPANLGNAPRWLPAEGQRQWRKVGKELAEIGVLSALDQHALALYCMEYARWREYQKRAKGAETLINDKGNEIQNPYLRLADRAFDHMLKIMSEFGMTPSSRTRLQVQPEEDFDPMEEFLRGG